MFNECLEIRWKTAHFCILNFSCQKQYQEFDTVFRHLMKHLENRQEYFAARRGDETRRFMLDVIHK